MALDKFRETFVTWDKANKKVYQPLRVSGSDEKGRKLVVQVVNDGVIEDLTGTNLSLAWDAKNGKTGLDPFTQIKPKEGIFELFYTNRMLQNVGVLRGNFSLNDATGRIVSDDFHITVFDKIDDSAAGSQAELSLLQQALTKVNQYDGKISKVSSEVMSARGAHPDLSQRLLSTDQKLSETEYQTEQKQRLYKTNFPNGTKTSGMVHVMGGIDSLTNGAGGSKYGDYFASRMKGEFGQGGTGYVGFNDGTGVDGFGSVVNNGFDYIKNLIPGASYSAYSLDNKGIYIENPTGSELYKHDFTLTSYENITLYYLKQPNGGSFDVFYDADEANTKQNVKTLHMNNDVGSVSLGKKRGTSGIRINNCTGGKVVIFGVFLHNDSGFIFSPIGKGGDKLQWHNATDSLMRKKWLELLKPDIYIFNGGMNDRGVLGATEYDTMLKSYLEPFLLTATHIMLCRPNAINAGENLIEVFEPVLIQYAQDKNMEYINIKEILGDFKTASNQGYMLDGVHPNKLGNRKIANMLLERMSVNKIGKSYSRTEDPIKNNQFVTLLCPIYKPVEKGATESIYSLGFKNSWTNGIVELEINGFRNGTTQIVKKKVTFVFQCATVLNTCNQVSDISVTKIFSNTSAYDFDVTVAVEKGLAVVKVTSPTLKINAITEGKVIYSYVGIGKSVWEN